MPDSFYLQFSWKFRDGQSFEWNELIKKKKKKEKRFLILDNLLAKSLNELFYTVGWCRQIRDLFFLSRVNNFDV